MCGRYTLSTRAEVIAEMFGVATVPEVEPRYNIAPTQSVPIVRVAPEGSGRALEFVHWGLIPSWADDPKIGNKMINARGETVASKPSFRSAFKNRRCLVVTDGFYEWRKTSHGKQPYLIRRPGGEPFAFAGLWEFWKGAAEPVVSCTIITTEANRLMAPIHDRMPTILDPEDYEMWLDPAYKDTDRLQALIAPEADGKLIAFPVSTRVNSPGNDDPTLLEPLESEHPKSEQGGQNSK
jgi:putative SOS response-associated peptidase YedK